MSHFEALEVRNSICKSGGGVSQFSSQQPVECGHYEVTDKLGNRLQAMKKRGERGEERRGKGEAGWKQWARAGRRRSLQVQEGLEQVPGLKKGRDTGEGRRSLGEGRAAE
jgi:hypothetical protein